MLVKLYENVVNEDGSRSPGRPVGEIRCKGDGTPGKIEYFEAGNEVWEIRDVKHNCYGSGRKIFDKFTVPRMELIFSRPLFVTTAGGITADGIHYTEGTTLNPWTRAGMEEIINYKLAHIGSICGEIVED